MEKRQLLIAASARGLVAVHGDQQVDVARMLGITQPVAGRKLRGVTRWSIADVDRLAEHYGVTSEQIMAGPWSWLGLEGPEMLDTSQYRFCTELGPALDLSMAS